jgi:hypothetical protein
MTPAEARKAPGKNVILQAVGLNPDVRVAIGRLELRRGDRLMLCSDGVTNQINDDELREILTKSEPRAACDTIIALANERGGDDNETVIVADVLGEELNEPVEFESVTSTFEVLQAFEARPSGKPRRRAMANMPSGAAQPVKVTSSGTDESAEKSPDLPEITVEGASDGASDGKPDGKSDGASDGKSDGATAAPADNPTLSSDSLTAIKEVAPEKRGWISSLLGRLSKK